MIAVLLTVALAQPKPVVPADFSGTWTYDAAKTAAHDPKKPAAGASGGGSVGMLPPDLVIEQTPATLTITHEVFGITTKAVLNLTGTESTNRSGAVTKVTRSHWEGATLVTEGKYSQVTSAGYDEWQVKETRSIDKLGAMVIQNRSVGLTGVVTTGTAVFVKRKS